MTCYFLTQISNSVTSVSAESGYTSFRQLVSSSPFCCISASFPPECVEFHIYILKNVSLSVPGTQDGARTAKQSQTFSLLVSLGPTFSRALRSIGFYILQDLTFFRLLCFPGFHILQSSQFSKIPHSPEFCVLQSSVFSEIPHSPEFWVLQSSMFASVLCFPGSHILQSSPHTLDFYDLQDPTFSRSLCSPVSLFPKVLIFPCSQGSILFTVFSKLQFSISSIQCKHFTVVHMFRLFRAEEMRVITLKLSETKLSENKFQVWMMEGY